MKELYSLPGDLLESLEGVPGFDKNSFEAVHASGRQVTGIRLNPLKIDDKNLLEFPIAGDVPWTAYGYYLAERPSFTLDPLLHAGAYYVQDASSMFLEQAIKQTTDLSQPLRVLDLCAAPGGKSTHIQSLISPESVLVSNELIRNRVNILSENITKWGAANIIITNNDPSDFSTLENLFDLVVVDAPCSGSGLFRKDPAAIEEWSMANVQQCSVRQQKILNDVWPSLKPGGVLIYSTCSYSLAEDEMIADWLTETTNANSLPLKIDVDWGIVETTSLVHHNHGYRFYPDKLDGEGFYLACFKKELNESNTMQARPIKNKVDNKVVQAAAKWLAPGPDLSLYQHKEQVFAMPADTLQLFLQLQSNLNIRKAGVKIGDIARDEIIPGHALALSNICNKEITTLALDKKDAIDFLRKAELDLHDLPKGWLMITYESFPLGWIKSMGNRINNYYPKEWRIRM